MRFFKPRRLCIAAILLAGVGVCWWVMYEPVPVIRFVEFQTDEEKIVAVLRLENPSEIVYRSDGHGPQPLVEWSVWDGSKWDIRTWWLTASGREIMPKGGFTLRSKLPTGSRSGDRMKCNIAFYRQTEPSQDGFVARILNWLGGQRSGQIIVWSDVVVVE